MDQDEHTLAGENPQSLGRRIQAFDSFTLDPVEESLSCYRPKLIALFGEVTTRTIMEDPGIEEFLSDVYDAIGPAKALHQAAAHLRDHPAATPAAAFAAVQDQISEP